MTEFSSPAAVLLEGAGLAGLLLATLTDIRSRIIPNGLVLWVIGFGCAARIATDGLDAWISLGAALAVFVPLAVLAHRDQIGGGDAKMIGAVTLLVEPARVVSLLLAIALSGGALAIGWLIAEQVRKAAARPRPLPVFPGPAQTAPTPFTGSPPSAAHRQMPYAVAILAGVALTLLRLA